MTMLDTVDFWICYYERLLRRLQRARPDDVPDLLSDLNTAGRQLHWTIRTQPSADPATLALMDRAGDLFEQTARLIRERTTFPAAQHAVTAACCRAEWIAAHRRSNVEFNEKLAALCASL